MQSVLDTQAFLAYMLSVVSDLRKESWLFQKFSKWPPSIITAIESV
jgi:hypothetical protein